MKIPEPLFEKLTFLARVIEKEIQHLKYSSSRVFSGPFTFEQIEALEKDADFAAQLEAYTSRFCRLQDTLGDKVLPAWLESLGESSRSVIDNLDKANKLGVQIDSDEWLMIRQLRNKMVHEYIEAKEIFLNTINAAHDYEEKLFSFAADILNDLTSRGITINCRS